MRQPMASGLCEELARLNPADPEYAAHSVDLVLAAARNAGASDVHFQPTGDGLEVKCRVDGVLAPVAAFPANLAVNIIARLKVLSGLREMGLITQEEYNARRKAILDQL